MATRSDIWAEEQSRRILGRVETELPELESRVDKLCERYGISPSRPDPLYTDEQAVDAICYQIGSLISKIADEHLLDRDELLNGVWRSITLDSVRARPRKLDILADLAHVLKNERHAQR